MASPGGSGVSGGPPRSGVDIVRNMSGRGSRS